ncbi:MAG TPA: nickel ABC transporter permease [Acidimicrobiales bacterium]|nr:nickel ABC transporter permease [Acidimicrobiales bacterium]
MPAYLLRRLLLVVPTLIGVSLLAFGLANLTPGDPAVELLRRTTDHQPSPSEVVETRHELGLDRPLVVQYVSWVRHAATGDLGISYDTRRPVAGEIARRVPNTLAIAIPAAVAALLFALVFGVASAFWRNRWPDHLIRVVSVMGASMPGFWLALLLIVLFSVRLSLLPVAGREAGLRSYVLPVVTLTLAPMAVLSRFTRSAMLQTLDDDYVRTARSKGLGGWRVVGHHALRNAAIPVVTAFGTSLGYLISGAVIVETIFLWPGVGKLAVDAILQRDYPMIEGFTLYAGVAFVVINLFVDLSYGAFDPRVRIGTGAKGGQS